jgi:prepilin peptidase CpaA
LEEILETVILLLGMALFVAAAYGDVKTHRIPNWLVAAVAVVGIARLIAIGDLSFALHTVSVSLLVLIATFLLFWRGLVGGGDAKLLPATALLVGYPDLLNFLVLMSLCGALVSIAILVTRRGALFSLVIHFIHGPSEQPQEKLQLVVPYGTAIAAGAIVTLLFQSSILG